MKEPYSFRRSRRRTPEVGMAPLLDMMFILLIFFLVTTTFTGDTGIEIRKPRAASSTELSPGHIRVTITRDGGLFLDGQPVSLSSLQPRTRELLEQNPSTPVVIFSDEETRTGNLVHVLDECRRAGAESLSLATRTESGSRP